jgi:hypothetical protein
MIKAGSKSCFLSIMISRIAAAWVSLIIRIAGLALQS